MAILRQGATPPPPPASPVGSHGRPSAFGARIEGPFLRGKGYTDLRPRSATRLEEPLSTEFLELLRTSGFLRQTPAWFWSLRDGGRGRKGVG